MRYVVWTYDYAHASSGPKALHYLVNALNRAGQRAEVGGGWAVNPEWDEPRGHPSGEFTAVYPEIVHGNPWNAPRVARWVLNHPGLLGGDREYPPSEAVFTWHPPFMPGAPVLWAPHIELDIYRDLGLPRSGEMYYTGRGHGQPRGAEVTHAMRNDRHALADALNRAEVLYCHDVETGMADLALLCGCPVVMGDGRRLEPDGYRERYEARAAEFPAQLAAFIGATQ